MMAPRPLVFCGPSGVGKSTLLKKLMADYPDTFGFSVSHTTRAPRVGEQDGREYFFIDRKAFQDKVQGGSFLETAEFSGNYYGTSSSSLLDVVRSGKWCILDIEMQGVQQVKKSSAIKEAHYTPVYVFIKPPSIEHLKTRLVSRNTDSEEAIARRLQKAAEEIEYGTQEGNFDIVIVNDDLDAAYGSLKGFLDPLLKESSSE